MKGTVAAPNLSGTTTLTDRSVPAINVTPTPIADLNESITDRRSVWVVRINDPVLAAVVVSRASVQRGRRVPENLGGLVLEAVHPTDGSMLTVDVAHSPLTNLQKAITELDAGGLVI